jgi:hypothetical protein
MLLAAGMRALGPENEGKRAPDIGHQERQLDIAKA